jgi:sporulation protein YlmC with PRC-barrel domain
VNWNSTIDRALKVHRTTRGDARRRIMQTRLEERMLKSLMLSAAIGALTVSGALAQATTPANPPAATTAPAATNSAKFIPAQSPDQWVFSKFKGTDVVGPDNAHIGNVNDILFDKNGKIDGLIVGVGGFLGIGEKNVAIDMTGFQVVPASTGSNSTAAANDDPTNVKLKVSWTKDQLKQAPDFQYYKAPARQTSAPSPTTGMTPRSAPPAPTR